MKHLFRDSIIFFIDSSGLSWFYRMLQKKNGPLVRVVVFHDVADPVWFENVMNFFAQHYCVISPEDFENKNFDPKNINILLTFDDGYESWTRHCLPVLKKYGFKGLFFVTTSLLDHASDKQKTATFMKERLHIHPKEALSWEGLRMLRAEGHTIGGHTHTHPNLRKISPVEAKNEITLNKQKLEQPLAISLTHFAYPFGRKKHKDQAVYKMVCDAGYAYVYSAETGFVTSFNGEIPRMCIEKNQNIVQLGRWVHGAYDLFSRLRTAS